MPSVFTQSILFIIITNSFHHFNSREISLAFQLPLDAPKQQLEQCNNCMCIISNLIVIDQFSFKSNDHCYILTHWHSDHYQGITHSWNFGPIFTSKITKNLLLTKYPELKEKVFVLELGKWKKLIQNKQLEVIALDSNHMAGSIMLVIRYENKFYLHTGDMRFNRKIAENNPLIFEKISKTEFKCIYTIQQLHLDNTFCDPIFKFPSRSRALRLVIDLINQHNPSRLYLCTDTIGKQQAFIILSKFYKTKIAINEQRMMYIKQMEIDVDKYFTLDIQQTWIEVIPRAQKQQKITKCAGSIGVTLTGWANLDTSYPEGYRSYLVPYSLHSNFREMELLVSWIRPKTIKPIVREGQKWQKFSKKMNTYKGYVFSLSNIKQRGLQFFQKQYCTIQ